MALVSDIAKGVGGAGPIVLVGVGALILGPPLLRMIGRAARPVARRAVRSGVAVRDGIGDLVEESRAEMGRRGEAEGGEPAPRRRGAPPAQRGEPSPAG